MGVRTRGLDIAINAKRQVADAAARAEAKGAVIERWNEQLVASVGEIGITGTAGAVANAVWLATGIRVRKFPIALDRLIEPHS
jgi:CO/xanthine dehydrogenase Mo-binding subunit